MMASGAAAPAEAATPDDLPGRLRELADDAARRPLLEDALAAQDPDALVAALKAAAERLWQVDPHASLRIAEAIVLAGELAGRPDHVALGLMAKGDTLRLLGRYPESLSLLDEAGQRFLSLEDEVGWARTRIGRVVTAQLLGEGEAALAHVDRARAVLLAHGERLRAASLDVNTAVACRRLGRFEDALRLYDQAQLTYESLGPGAALRAAGAKMNKAIILTFRGQFGEALTLHEAARAVFASHGDTVSMLRIDQSVAWLNAGLGDYTRALRLLVDALALAEGAQLEADAGLIMLNMIECYLSLNRYPEAAELAGEAAERFERCGTPTEAAKAKLYGSLARARRGEHDQALTLLAQATETLAAAGLTSEVAVAALQRAALRLSEQDWEAALEEATRAHALFSERGLVVREVQATLLRARAALALGDDVTAAGLARAALHLIQERGLDWLAHEGHHICAGVATARGDLEEALAALRTAITSIEQVQGRQAAELRANFLDDKLAVYHDAIDLCLRLDRPALAFEYLERAKSRALVDYLAANPEVRLRARREADQVLVDQLTRLRREHNWFYSRLYGRGLGSGPEVTPAEAAALEAAIRDREKRIARIQERLALRAQDLAGVVAPPAAETLAPPSLDANTVLLECYLRESGGVVFVRTADHLRALPLAIPLAIRPRQLQALLHRWQLSLDATARALAGGAPLAGLQRNATGILGALYGALIQPVAEHLAGRERVVVIPYGPAHGVPWHALFDGRRHLLEYLEVVTCPSSALFRLCAGQRPSPGRALQSALVVAFSDGGRLPHVGDEARTVARLFPGERYLEEEATGARLVAAAPRHGIIHLAAHGEARLDNPTFAHLQLADGQLTTSDVFNLSLDGALVTLSACETGRSVVTGGDELIGLARGFLFAGASTLVQSLWRVEDGSTARLMARFYQALRAGHAKGASLRAAQLSLLAEGLPPYCWAPFQLVGDAGPLVPAGPAHPEEVTTHGRDPA